MIRMAGADIIFTGDYRGKFPGGTKDLGLRNVSTVTSEFKHIKPAAPFVTGGGVHPGVVPGLVDDYGNDIIIGVGGGLHGHPMGSRAVEEHSGKPLTPPLRRGRCPRLPTNTKS